MFAAAVMIGIQPSEFGAMTIPQLAALFANLPKESGPPEPRMPVSSIEEGMRIIRERRQKEQHG